MQTVGEGSWQTSVAGHVVFPWHVCGTHAHASVAPLPPAGGPAAILAQDCIKHVEVLEYPELGMEAVWRIRVENFPAFIVVDDKGNDFFATWQV